MLIEGRFSGLGTTFAIAVRSAIARVSVKSSTEGVVWWTSPTGNFLRVTAKEVLVIMRPWSHSIGSASG